MKGKSQKMFDGLAVFAIRTTQRLEVVTHTP